MRARLVFILAAIFIVAGFSALNWSEVTRSAPLSFGATISEAPLGLILLAVLFVTLVAFLFSNLMSESHHLIEQGRTAKTLQQQRDLADKAEASRFTELRAHIDSHLRDNRQRETIAATEFEKAMVMSQRDLRNQLELMDKTLIARLGEFEKRFDSRIDRLQAADVTARAKDVPLKDRVQL